ncbi:MAG: DNA-3-methyladenine glycosylase [Flavobacteriales bacterium]|nr:DNA-3-methyladenine glycosylase [Flavobacteriales bacterium]MBP9080066.1 DNA-3-methyladenine glycosylase [Flavobacteriales bacterium]
MYDKLPRSFYDRADVVRIARELLGMVLATKFHGRTTAGIITETEAYNGATDRASHAHGGKVTPRNRIMYGGPGHAYVYLCYGIHHLFNVVTNGPGVAHAVLIRAIHPLEGKDLMLRRRKTKLLSTSGPGMLTQALGIRTRHNGTDLLNGPIWLEDRGYIIPAHAIITGPRIGVDYAGADALLPYRFHFDPLCLP